MLRTTLLLASLAVLAAAVAPGLRRGLFFSNAPAEPLHASSRLGAPLILTDLLDDPVRAQSFAKVTGVGNYTSYAGFFRVNETLDNNLFAWYFPAQSGDPKAPLTVWLQGGPGGASLFGLFSEVGPFSLTEDLELVPNAFTWNAKYGQLFIDNPVGAGFSYTGTGKGYASNSRGDVARDLYELLQQFYDMFPEQRANDFYITGESYAGHYIPSIGAKIYRENQAGQRKHIPLKGVAIGDGWTDPINQLLGYGPLMFNLGLADKKQQAYIDGMGDQAIQLIKQGQYAKAFEEWDKMLNGDIYPYPNYFHNITGSNDYDNFMRTESPVSFGYYAKFVTQPKIRTAIHVGNAVLNDGKQCELHLLNDVMDSYAPELVTLMENYKVLLYNGQLDLIVGVPLTEIFLQNLKWSGASAYQNANRTVWKVQPDDVEVAGFVRNVNEFTQIVVRGAGHIVPYDQPRRAYDMISRFIDGKPF